MSVSNTATMGACPDVVVDATAVAAAVVVAVVAVAAADHRCLS